MLRIVTPTTISSPTAGVRLLSVRFQSSKSTGSPGIGDGPSGGGGGPSGCVVGPEGTVVSCAGAAGSSGNGCVISDAAATAWMVMIVG